MRHVLRDSTDGEFICTFISPFFCNRDPKKRPGPDHGSGVLKNRNINQWNHFTLFTSWWSFEQYWNLRTRFNQKGTTDNRLFIQRRLENSVLLWWILLNTRLTSQRSRKNTIKPIQGRQITGFSWPKDFLVPPLLLTELADICRGDEVRENKYSSGL